MKTVYLMRHAKSSWSNALLPDHARPLNRRGQKQATQMGALLKSEGMLPDLVLASNAERTRETLALVTAVAEFTGPTQLLAALYGASEDDYLQIMAALPDQIEKVLFIGHNPTLEGLVHKLTEVEVAMKTATMVRVVLPIDRWSAISEGSAGEGRLAGVWQPKED